MIRHLKVTVKYIQGTGEKGIMKSYYKSANLLILKYKKKMWANGGNKYHIFVYCRVFYCLSSLSLSL